MEHDDEFTGADLERLVIDIQAAVGRNKAGLTPLGMAVMDLTTSAMKRNAEKTKPALLQ